VGGRPVAIYLLALTTLTMPTMPMMPNIYSNTYILTLSTFTNVLIEVLEDWMLYGSHQFYLFMNSSMVVINIYGHHRLMVAIIVVSNNIAFYGSYQQIEKILANYIEFKDNSNCKHRCPGRERQPGIASPSGDNNPSPLTARPRRS
jgi:hypothetical protein